MKKNSWMCCLLLLAGIVIGGFIGSVFPNSFLNYGQTFGLTSPFVLDLGIITLSFGLTIQVTIASIIGLVVGIILYRVL